ncbi:hypothetical protein [Delftia tsuruhatensis]|uniref:hypothetical protein n=1 Tax=Delftia tsuruhatensis TaxID=180282 RepID=UPI003A87200E
MLERFNAIREEGADFPGKARFLKETINKLIKDGKLKLTKNTENSEKTRIVEINIEKGGSDEYKIKEAEKNRGKYLENLVGQEHKYPGVCLPGSKICKEV